MKYVKVRNVLHVNIFSKQHQIVCAVALFFKILMSSFIKDSWILSIFAFNLLWYHKSFSLQKIPLKISENEKENDKWSLSAIMKIFFTSQTPWKDQGNLQKIPDQTQRILSTFSCFSGKKFMIQFKQKREQILGAISKPPNKKQRWLAQ